MHVEAVEEFADCAQYCPSLQKNCKIREPKLYFIFRFFANFANQAPGEDHVSLQDCDTAILMHQIGTFH